MDVCAAMKYLSEMLCIVRVSQPLLVFLYVNSLINLPGSQVISSRTVYVTEDERCKITDFGLARKAVDGLYSSMVQRLFNNDRQTEGQTDRQTDGRTDRQKQTDFTNMFCLLACASCSSPVDSA